MKSFTQNSDRILLPRSICDVLTQISNDFQRSLHCVQCWQTLAVVARLVQTCAASQFAYYPSYIVFENRISMSQIIVCLKKYAKDSGTDTTSS